MEQQKPSKQNMRPEAFQLATAHQLGSPLKEDSIGACGRVGCGLISIGLGLLFSILALSYIVNPVVNPWVAVPLMGLIALLPLWWGIYILIDTYRDRNVWDCFCTKGFIRVRDGKVEKVVRWDQAVMSVYRDSGLWIGFSAEGFICIDVRNSQAEKKILWDQVEAVWQYISKTRHYVNGIPVWTTTSRNYIVQTIDGTKFNFSDEEVGNVLLRESNRHLLPKAVAAYSTGNPVIFGLLRVSQQGVSFGYETLPWKQVISIQVNRGFVTIKKTDEKGKLVNWHSITASSIPNLFVFLTLVDLITRTRQQGTRV